MLSSALSRQRLHIDTSTIIYKDEFIDDPTQVKRAIQDSAKKWTRKRHLNSSIPGWEDIYNPIDSIEPNTFSAVSDQISEEEITQAIKESPNNKAAGPSKLTYECWKKSPRSVVETLVTLFNQVMHE